MPTCSTLKLMTLDATLGFGKHFWDVDPKNVIILRKVRFLPRPFYNHQLISIALLHFPNILSSCTGPGKGLYSLFIPPDFPRQTVSPYHIHSTCVDGFPHRYFCLRRCLPVHTRRSLVGPVGSWKVCRSAGIRVCGCCSKHFRGHRHHVSPSLRIKRFDTEPEEEARFGFHVRPWVLVCILQPVLAAPLLT